MDEVALEGWLTTKYIKSGVLVEWCDVASGRIFMKMKLSIITNDM